MPDPASPSSAAAAAPEPLPTTLIYPPFTFGKVIGEAFRVFGRNMFTFGGVAVAFYAPAIAVEMAISSSSAPASLESARLGTMLWNVLGCLVTAGLTRGTLEVLRGRRPALSAMFGSGFGRGLRVLGASILVNLITVLGLIMLVVPGLMAAAGLYVATAAAVAEPDRPVRASIQRSWSLTRGHRWAVLGLGVLFLSIAMAASFAYGAAAEMMGPAGAAVGGVVVSMAFGLQSVAVAVTYHALQAEKEGAAPRDLGAVFE